MQPRFFPVHGGGAYHGAKYEPGRRRVFISVCRPGQARSADEPAIDSDSGRPVEIDRLFGRGVYSERVAERREPGIQHTAGFAQWLVGFEHDGEFRKIETADMNQRTRTR